MALGTGAKQKKKPLVNAGLLGQWWGEESSSLPYDIVMVHSPKLLDHLVAALRGMLGRLFQMINTKSLNFYISHIYFSWYALKMSITDYRCDGMVVFECLGDNWQSPTTLCFSAVKQGLILAWEAEKALISIRSISKRQWWSLFFNDVKTPAVQSSLGITEFENKTWRPYINSLWSDQGGVTHGKLVSLRRNDTRVSGKHISLTAFAFGMYRVTAAWRRRLQHLPYPPPPPPLDRTTHSAGDVNRQMVAGRRVLGDGRTNKRPKAAFPRKKKSVVENRACLPTPIGI